MKKTLALPLAMLLPLALVAQEAVAPATDPLIPIDPGWRKKEVVVRLRDARVYQGKLVEIQPDTLLLQVKDLDPTTRKKVTRTETIPRSQVVWVQRVGRNKTRLWGLVIGLGAILIPIALVVGLDENQT
ncbi:MAG: hypothetical protein L0212_10305 [Acidobacteria bacterium]|nr:hypothetical protein [Acidobacteriota bacterium]